MTYTLYHFPFTCSRVTMSALEETGAAYDVVLVNVIAGAQRSPEYLRVNPHGKVPALVADGRLLTENAALLLHLDAVFPQAGLLPRTADPIARGAALSDLLWCSGSLHPLARMLRAPAHYTVGDVAPVEERGRALAPAMLAEFEARLGTDDWWFGPVWSIVDVYVWWLASTCASTGVDLAPYPAVTAHAARVRARASFERMVARETSALASAGIALPPGLSL